MERVMFALILAPYFILNIANMTKTRGPLGKTTRFNIFKRDSFTCQYCGNTPPSVTLEIDHVLPVSKGGGNNPMNLITACFDCNRGKRDTLLTVIPKTENVELLIEKENQIKSYNNYIQRKRKRLNNEIKSISDIFESESNESAFTETFKNVSLKMFIEKIGYTEVETAIYKALARGLYDNQTIKYFCGICHNKIRETNG